MQKMGNCNNKIFFSRSSFDDDTKEIIELLIDSDANIEAVNEDGCSPIHFALANKQLDVIKVIFNYTKK